MEVESLVGVRAKLDRADVHLRDLNEGVNAFLGKDNCRFVGETHPEGPYEHRFIYLEVDEFPPDEVWGPIIGDVVHNLRSALDHLAWEVALPDARAKNPARIEFPIFFDNPSHNARVRGLFQDKIDRLRPEFRTGVERVQPYKAGDLHHPLWLLERLRNTDQHRTLHTALFMFTEHPDDPANPFGYASWSHSRMDRAERRTEIVHMYGNFNESLQEKVDANEAMTRDVALGKPLDPPTDVPWTRDYPFNGLPLRQMLRRIRRYIETEVIAPLPSLSNP